MKAKTGIRVATWILSLGLATGVGTLCALLVLAFVPAPGTPLDAILLLMVSVGFACAVFGSVWLVYWIASTSSARRPGEGVASDCANK